MDIRRTAGGWLRRARDVLDCGPRRPQPPHSFRDGWGRRWALWCDGRWIDVAALPFEQRSQLLRRLQRVAADDGDDPATWPPARHVGATRRHADGTLYTWTGRLWVELPPTFARPHPPADDAGRCTCTNPFTVDELDPGCPLHGELAWRRHR